VVVPPKVSEGGLRLLHPKLSVFNSDLDYNPYNISTIFLEKDFFKIFNDIHDYGTVFIDRIRERQ